MNGVRTAANASKPGKKGIYNDMINISESISEKNPRLLRGGIVRQSTGERPLGVPFLERPVEP